MHLSRRRRSASLNGPCWLERPKCRWTIVITDTASELPEKLLGMGGSQLLVLKSGASCEEDKLPASMLELLAETIRLRDAGAIVVFGQSQETTARSQTNSDAHTEGASSYSRLLRRMSDRLQGRRRTQNRVRVRFNQIRLDARLAAASILQGISLCGLYHLTESNVFMLYDDSEDRFVPLVDTSHSLT